MEAIKSIMSGYKDEIKRRKEEKKRKKETQDPFPVRAKRFVKASFLIAFYTVFFVSFSYVFIMFCTSILPSAISVIVVGLGYKLTTVAEMFLGACVGLFFTAWVFVISFVVIRKAFSIYINAVKKQLPKKRTDENAANAEEAQPAAPASENAKKQPIKMKKK